MRQFFSFGAVGVAGYVVDTATLMAVTSFVGPYFGRLISFVVAVTTTWLLNRSFTFRQHPSGRRSHHEFAIYLVSMLGGGVTNLTVYAVLVVWLDPSVMFLPLFVACGSLAGMLVNFTLARRVVFSSARSEPLLPPRPVLFVGLSIAFVLLVCMALATVLIL